MLSDEDVISLVAIFNAFDIDALSLNARIAPISSKQSILVAVRGATLDLETTRWTETVPSLC